MFGGMSNSQFTAIVGVAIVLLIGDAVRTLLGLSGEGRKFRFCAWCEILFLRVPN
jgi:hypothetical protein